MIRDLFDAIAAARPDDAETRLVYADALEDLGDTARAEFVRVHLAMRDLEPDDVRWTARGQELSRLRRQIDASPEWLQVIEPERRFGSPSEEAWWCDCFATKEGSHQLTHPVALHRDVQDTECPAWKRVCENVENAAGDKREKFAPLEGLSEEEAATIITLPATIAKLTHVKELHMYGTCISRLPPEIGEMKSLEVFIPYTSYRLHWFPYEISRCNNLRKSTVSTRALYGNYKQRWPFPELGPRRAPFATRRCSVCNTEIIDEGRYRVWIALRIATDVLPLLVNACSKDCIAKLPPGDARHVTGAHRGGPNVMQPKRE